MKFLLERNILNSEEQENFKNYTSTGDYETRRLGWIQKYLSTRPNYDYLKSALDVYARNLDQYGFDTSDNRFIIFMQNIKVFCIAYT